jgi:Protein of unknown function (DUF2510)
MTTTQPGWYLDPAGSGLHRYWDGSQWTERVAALNTGVAPTLTAPDGTNPNTVWIWALVVVPALLNAATVIFSLSSALGLESLVVFVIYVGGIVLAFLDSRALKRRGVPRPFGWGWQFLTVIYVIGRSVIVRRRTGRGLVPLWIYIAVVLVSDAVAASVRMASGG